MDSRNDIMAQAVFLAQLEAAKGKCNCKACAILRRSSDMMTAQFLNPQAASPAADKDVEKTLEAAVEEVVSFKEGGE